MAVELIYCIDEEKKYKMIMNNRLKLNNPKSLIVVDNIIIQTKILKYFKEHYSILNTVDDSSTSFHITNQINQIKNLKDYEIIYFVSKLTYKKNISKFPIIEKKSKIYSTSFESTLTTRSFKINNKIHLQNDEIPKVFWDSFLFADSEILILSPWIGSFILKEKYQKYFHYALKNGVKICIHYGIGQKYDRRNNQSEKIVSIIKDNFKRFDNLIFKRVNSHYKLMICDQKFLMVGSYNFLSFEGKYETDNRGEGVDLIINKNEINQKKELYFSR